MTSHSPLGFNTGPAVPPLTLRCQILVQIAALYSSLNRLPHIIITIRHSHGLPVRVDHGQLDGGRGWSLRGKPPGRVKGRGLESHSTAHPASWWAVSVSLEGNSSGHLAGTGLWLRHACPAPGQPLGCLCNNFTSNATCTEKGTLDTPGHCTTACRGARACACVLGEGTATGLAWGPTARRGHPLKPDRG